MKITAKIATLTQGLQRISSHSFHISASVESVDADLVEIR